MRRGFVCLFQNEGEIRAAGISSGEKFEALLSRNGIRGISVPNSSSNSRAGRSLTTNFPSCTVTASAGS